MSRIFLLSLSLGLMGLVLFLKSTDNPVLEYFQLKVFDQFQQIHPREYRETPVVIADIDEESLKRLGQWPWPRKIIADMVNKLGAAGAAAITFDVVFAETDRTSPHLLIPQWEKESGMRFNVPDVPNYDDLLADAVKNNPTVLGFVMTNAVTTSPTLKTGLAVAGAGVGDGVPHFLGAVGSLPKLVEPAAGYGAFNSDPDKDGILRRVPLLFTANGKLYPSLAAEAMRVAQGASTVVVRTVGANGELGSEGQAGITAVKIGGIEIPTDAAGRMWIYYTPFYAARYIPVWKILAGEVPPESIAGKIVLVGTSAAGLLDIRATPLNPAANGVEVHAQLLEQATLGEFLKRPDWVTGAEMLVMVAAGFIVMFVTVRVSPLWGAAVMVGIIGASVWASWESFIRNGILIDPVTPAIVVVLIYLSESLFRFMRAETERRHIRHAFTHYMSPALVEQLAKHPEKLVLGGESRMLSVLFMDVRSFSRISESMTAHELTTFLNQFLTPMTDVVLHHQGVVDKYMGDSIMAFWNAPLDDPQHARNACLAALGMHSALEEFNKTSNRQVAIGVGINTGECCVGNLGSSQRFDYSVIGDNVNLASRLEGQCKYYHLPIIIGAETASDAMDLAVMEIDRIQVKGKDNATEIFTLLGDAEFARGMWFQTLADTMATLLEQYRAQNWDAALATLEELEVHSAASPVRLTGLLSLYRERLVEYRAHPPGPDWEGVYKATEK